MKSNCLIGAIAIKKRIGGKLRWRSGWRHGGYHGLIGNPWGHWYVRLPDNTLLSYSASDKRLPALKQLWFRGYIKRVRAIPATA